MIKSINTHRTIPQLWTWATYGSIGTIFISVLFTPSTVSDPAGAAGIGAPLIALCFSSNKLCKSIYGSRKLLDIFGCVCVMAGIYLGIAVGAKINPSNPELLAQTVLFFPLSTLVFFGVLFPMSPFIPQLHELSLSRKP